MTLLLIFLTCAFTLYALYQTVAPFLESHDDQLRAEILDEELTEIEQLVARKAALLQALRDLDYDFETSKIAEEDYRRFKTSCERQAVGVMRRLDAIHGGRGWEDVIDQEVATRRARLQAGAPEIDEPDVQPAALDCPSCGKPLEQDARFCSQCGTPIRGEASDDHASPSAENDLARVDNPVGALRTEVSG